MRSLNEDSPGKMMCVDVSIRLTSKVDEFRTRGSDYDKVLADVRLETASFTQTCARQVDALRADMREEIAKMQAIDRTDVVELQKKYNEERDARVKLERQVASLLRWQEEQSFVQAQMESRLKVLSPFSF
jgi:uncharacterized protein involved in exopolysaccharide biosynthesis